MHIKKVSKAMRLELEAIAKSELLVKTLKVRGMDDLDFPECSVIGIMKALKRAYWLGVETEQKSSRTSQQ